jgi:hypothetical protein
MDPHRVAAAVVVVGVVEVVVQVAVLVAAYCVLGARVA